MDATKPPPPASPTHHSQTLHRWELCGKGPSDNYTRQCDTRSRRLQRAGALRGGKDLVYCQQSDLKLCLTMSCGFVKCVMPAFAYHFTTFEYFSLQCPLDAELFLLSKNSSQHSALSDTLLYLKSKLHQITGDDLINIWSCWHFVFTGGVLWMMLWCNLIELTQTDIIPPLKLKASSWF